MFLKVLLIKRYILIINLVNKLFFTEEKLPVKDEEKLQSSSKCWLCKKLFTDEDKKVSDHNHITEKYRGQAHSNCNINFKLNKNVPMIFYNLRGYDGHLIMEEITQFRLEISVIPNGLEKYVAFIIKKRFLLTACN